MPHVPSKAFRLFLAMAILSSCIGCDQAAKRIASRWLQNAPTQSYCGDAIRLQYALNPGGFLSLGSSLPPAARYWLLVGLNTVLMLVVCGVLIVRWNVRLPVFVALVCVLAGGIGNLIDRTTQGGLVADYMNVGVGPIRSGVFNVADVAVTFGAIALILCARKR